MNHIEKINLRMYVSTFWSICVLGTYHARVQERPGTSRSEKNLLTADATKHKKSVDHGRSARQKAWLLEPSKLPLSWKYDVIAFKRCLLLRKNVVCILSRRGRKASRIVPLAVQTRQACKRLRETILQTKARNVFVKAKLSRKITVGMGFGNERANHFRSKKAYRKTWACAFY